MKKYFIYRQGKHEGPFSKEELKDRISVPDIMIWEEGMDHWQKPSHIKELRDLMDQEAGWKKAMSHKGNEHTKVLFPVWLAAALLFFALLIVFLMVI